MKARRKFRESKSHAVAWVALLAVIALVFVGYRAVGSVFAIYNDWIADLPELNADAFDFAEESYVYAADGETLLAKFQLEKRDPIELKDVSSSVVRGTIDVEDVRFYEHDGVDMQGIGRAVVNNLLGGSLEGASTITQQLVRNTALSAEATDITLERKAREAELALEMEKHYTKDEILTMYLNTINYGDGCYGIEAAAKNYFQVSAKDLTLSQAAALVGIPQSPTAYNPKENLAACQERRNKVLERMYAAGDISEQEYEETVAAPLELNPAPDEPLQGIYAYPYFTSFVRDSLMQADNIYGCTYADLFQGGLKIYTTLDVKTQNDAEEACAAQYARMEAGLDAALVAMNPTNGYVLAMVGGNDFYNDQWNIAAQGGRPTGSAFKAFTLATAIEQGISPQAYLDCSNPVTLPNGQTVNNFGNASYGVRTIRDATAISSNTGYYRLTEQVGVDKLIEMAHRLGISAELPEYPIITLGTENVTPLEMAEAYSTFASGGMHHDYVIITRIENEAGQVLYEADTTGDRALSEEVAGAVTSVLRGVFELPYATAYGSGPANGQVVAGKTGTGVDYRDHVLAGYSPTLTCVAWIGNRDYSSTSAALTANSLWRDFMSRALDGTETVEFPEVEEPTYNRQLGLGIGSAQTQTRPDVSTINNYTAGSMTEDQLRQQYSSYTLQIGYQYSDTVPQGSVISRTYDQATGSIIAVVSQGRDPNASSAGAGAGAAGGTGDAGTGAAGTDAGSARDAGNAGTSAGGTSGGAGSSARADNAP